MQYLVADGTPLNEDESVKNKLNAILALRKEGIKMGNVHLHYGNECAYLKMVAKMTGIRRTEDLTKVWRVLNNYAFADENPFAPYASKLDSIWQKLDEEGFVVDEETCKRWDLRKKLVCIKLRLDNERYVEAFQAINYDDESEVRAESNEAVMTLAKNDEGKYQIEVVSDDVIDAVAVKTIVKEVPVEVVKEVPVEIDNTD